MRIFLTFMIWIGVFVPSLMAGELLPVGSESRKFLNINLQNKSVALSEFVGVKAKKPKPVVLSFWALWCTAEGKACGREMPLVQAWAEKNKDKVELFFINLDSKAEMDKVREYVDTKKVGGTVLLDFYQTTGKAYGVCEGNSMCKIPALYVIDAQGMIRMVAQGFDKTATELEAELSKAAFASPLAPPAATAGASNSAAKLTVLHNILVGLNHAELAKKAGLSQEELVNILKEAEAAAKKQWGL